MGYASIAHAYRLTEWMSTHLELNWFNVIESGGADATFKDQPGVAGLVEFEAGDLINLGASGADEHRDFVSVAAGTRFQVAENVSLGLAYEIPLTEKGHGLMAQRVTVHLTATF